MARKSRGAWYVSFEVPKMPGKRFASRATETFSSEVDAKHFAREKSTDGSKVRAGTLNPHQPKRMIAASDVSKWLDEEVEGQEPSSETAKPEFEPSSRS